MILSFFFISSERGIFTRRTPSSRLDVILEVQPLLTQSTQEVIDNVENIYHDLIKCLKTDNSRQGNMAFYVKYHLDRWLPECLVRKD